MYYLSIFKKTATIFPREKRRGISIPFLDFSQKSDYTSPMDKQSQRALREALAVFHLPRYDELPDTGYYLEQTAQYINSILAPLGCMEITSSMISNYVKKGLITSPARKLYYADQIAHLVSVTILKSVLSLEQIGQLFAMQRLVYTDQVAYDYFCAELENILFYQFDLKDTVEHIGVTSSREKTMLRSAIIAVSHVIYLNHCFQMLHEARTE